MNSFLTILETQKPEAKRWAQFLIKTHFILWHSGPDRCQGEMYEGWKALSKGPFRTFREDGDCVLAWISWSELGSHRVVHDCGSHCQDLSLLIMDCRLNLHVFWSRHNSVLHRTSITKEYREGIRIPPDYFPVWWVSFYSKPRNNNNNNKKKFHKP